MLRMERQQDRRDLDSSDFCCYPGFSVLCTTEVSQCSGFWVEEEADTVCSVQAVPRSSGFMGPFS